MEMRRNLAVLYWESVKTIGSPTVFYLTNRKPWENQSDSRISNRTQLSFYESSIENVLVFGLKVHTIYYVGFRLQSVRVSTKITRLLALILYELRLLDYTLYSLFLYSL